MACEREQSLWERAAVALADQQEQHAYLGRRIRQLVHELLAPGYHPAPTPAQARWARAVRDTWRTQAEVDAHAPPPDWPPPYQAIDVLARHRADVTRSLPELRRARDEAEQAYRRCAKTDGHARACRHHGISAFLFLRR